MAQFFSIHPDNPQPRLIKQSVDIIKRGGLIAYPTDSAYALGCHIGDKMALDRVRALRDLDKEHNFTLLCRDLSELASFARVDNAAFRLLRNHTPGPFTFILNATSDVPRRLLHPKRKTVGLRIPENNIALALVEELGEPMLTCSLILPDNHLPETDAEQIREQLEHQVDLVIDGGHCGVDPTTVVDLTGAAPVIRRQGKGELPEL